MMTTKFKHIIDEALKLTNLYEYQKEYFAKAIESKVKSMKKIRAILGMGIFTGEMMVEEGQNKIEAPLECFVNSGHDIIYLCFEFSRMVDKDTAIYEYTGFKIQGSFKSRRNSVPIGIATTGGEKGSMIEVNLTTQSNTNL